MYIEELLKFICLLCLFPLCLVNPWWFWVALGSHLRSSMLSVLRVDSTLDPVLSVDSGTRVLISSSVFFMSILSHYLHSDIRSSKSSCRDHSALSRTPWSRWVPHPVSTESLRNARTLRLSDHADLLWLRLCLHYLYFLSNSSPGASLHRSDCMYSLWLQDIVVSP